MVCGFLLCLDMAVFKPFYRAKNSKNKHIKTNFWWQIWWQIFGALEN
jgi:hypothetical protein